MVVCWHTCVGGFALGPPPSLDPPDRRREWSVAPPSPSIAVLPSSSRGFRRRVAAVVCFVVVAFARFIAHGDSRPGDRVQCLLAPEGGVWEYQHGRHRRRFSAPSSFSWSSSPSSSQGEPRPGMTISVALPSTVPFDTLTARTGSCGTTPHRPQSPPGFARQRPGCCHWPSSRRANVHSS